MTGTLHKLLLWPLMTFVCSLAALVVYQMLTGKIRTGGLLIDPRTGQTSALRVQQLLATIAFAGTYAAAIHNHPPNQGLPHLDPQGAGADGRQQRHSPAQSDLSPYPAPASQRR